MVMVFSCNLHPTILIIYLVIAMSFWLSNSMATVFQNLVNSLSIQYDENDHLTVTAKDCKPLSY